MSAIVWLRRDLRLHDHAAFAAALAGGGAVQPVFIFDTEILTRFTQKDDRRLTFIAHALVQLDDALEKRGGGLLVLHGKASKIMPTLAKALEVNEVVAGEDYEPSTRCRDEVVAQSMQGAKLRVVKDHLIFAPHEIVKEDGSPYKVFTPYSKAWWAALTPLAYAECRVKDKDRYADIKSSRRKATEAGLEVLDIRKGAAAMLEAIGYKETEFKEWPVGTAKARLSKFIEEKVRTYHKTRDHMGEDGTSRLSPYLRFGLVSVRECMRMALNSSLRGEAEAIQKRQAGSPRSQMFARDDGDKTWIKELIWREFYAMILFHYPESVTMEWNPAYRRKLDWSYNKKHFAAWQEGRTGYPVVDAAMRQLLTTGWMHNRARMIVASFLTKDLHIDWRLGEEHFAQYLMDYEQASNVGGWQWAASTGTDAQPWFRVFNPVLQSKKFDPDGSYIRRYVPELKQVKGDDIHEPWKLGLFSDYPAPIVDHAKAREQALAMFKKASGQ